MKKPNFLSKFKSGKEKSNIIKISNNDISNIIKLKNSEINKEVSNNINYKSLDKEITYHKIEI